MILKKAFLFLMIINIPLEIFSDMITKLNYSHTTYVNMGFDETKMYHKVTKGIRPFFSRNIGHES